MGLLALSACSKVPDHLLSEQKMQRVMHDMLLAESMINVDPQTYQTRQQRDELYQSVFRKYGITQAVYDSSLVWYGKNLDIYMKVYERVLADLGDEIVALGDVQAEAIASAANQDSVEIWPRRHFLTLAPRRAFNGTTFEVIPQSNYSSGSIFVLQLDAWGVTPHMRHFPEIRLCADQGDTTVVITEKIRRDGHHTFRLNTVPTKRVKRVFGYILDR
ncbi:MAG: DUF4296 domain-containing protein, partial [Parabacteroides sp.]